MSRADKKEEKKAKRKKKEEEIAAFRRRDGFLPYYSDTFFEEVKHFHSSSGIWVILAIIIVELAIGAPSVERVALLMGITLCLSPFYFMLRRILLEWMMHFGYQMEYDAMIRMAWGQREVIPYRDIQRALMTAPVKMTIKAIMVPSLHGYIRFPYEVGNAKQQTHVTECYDALRNKVQYEMPLMIQEDISYFDRMYTYNSSFGSCCRWLCFMELWVYGFNEANSPTTSMLFYYIATVLIQCYILDRLAKSIRLGKKNAKELQQRLIKYPRTTYKIKYHETWQFVLVAIATIGLNFCVVWCCWM